MAALWRYARAGIRLPAGTIQVDASGLRASITTAQSIIGHPDGTVIDVYPKTPSAGYILFDSTAQSGTIELRDLTVHGPTSGLEAALRATDIFRWVGHGDLIVDNVTVTGVPARAIQHSGRGNCTITNSTLNGYVSPVARWESFDSPTPGSLTVNSSTLTGYGSGTTSIGIYVHPHIPVTVTNSTFDTFARYGVYQNGTTPNIAPALIEDSVFRRCSIILSSAATATIRRVLWDDLTSTPGSILRGGAVIEDSVFRSSPWATMPSAPGSVIRFRRCEWGPGVIWCNFSTGTGLDIAFEDCTWTMTNWYGEVLVMGADASGAVTFTRCTINDAGTSGDGIRILGLVTLDRRGLTLRSSRPFWNLGPSVTVIG